MAEPAIYPRLQDHPLFMLGAKAQLETVLWHVGRIQTETINKDILLLDLRAKRDQKLNLSNTLAHQRSY